MSTYSEDDLIGKLSRMPLEEMRNTISSLLQKPNRSNLKKIIVQNVTFSMSEEELLALSSGGWTPQEFILREYYRWV